MATDSVTSLHPVYTHFDDIRDVFVLFCLLYARVEVIWFDTLISDQSLALHVVLINYVSDRTKVRDFDLGKRQSEPLHDDICYYRVRIIGCSNCFVVNYVV